MPARKTAAPQTLSPIVELDETAVRADLASADELINLQKMQAAAMEVGGLLGTIKTAQFYATVSDKLTAESFLKLKEGKKYKDLVIYDENQNLRQIADLNEACTYFLGKSYRRCKELVDNLEILGASLYEKAEEIGLKTRDYSALRALPENDQDLIKQAIESSNHRDAVAELIDSLVTRQQKVLAARDKTISELEDNAEANSSRLNKLREEKERVEDLLDKYQRGKVGADERVMPVSENIDEVGRALDEALQNLALTFAAAEKICEEEAEKPGEEQNLDALVPMVQRLRDALNRGAAQVGKLQAEFDDRLMHVIGAAEMFELREEV